ncbi:hypothetical protein B0G71_2632 [Paraburkholderia sp. BL27I4N3]|nr:hypothetical protein B0G71_2632 [Paraburkholderia sp. BL27I4N3]RKR46104.1 hypothetical protein B0G82_3780 [Paraburkholderia sp. BL17N1]
MRAGQKLDYRAFAQSGMQLAYQMRSVIRKTSVFVADSAGGCKRPG